MTLITPPAALPLRRVQWTLRQPHQVNRSGWTGRRQVVTTPGGSFWTCSAEFKPLIGMAEAKPWIGFFHSLEGQLHKFPVNAVDFPQHSGSNPVVVSGTAGSRVISLSANVAALAAGDRITIKLTDGTFQLVTLTAPMTGAVASFIPALRNTAATGISSVETVTPFAHVSLTSDSWTYSADIDQVYTLSFDAEEAF